jgi:hypothetical protein
MRWHRQLGRWPGDWDDRWIVWVVGRGGLVGTGAPSYKGFWFRRPGKTGGGSTRRGSVFAVACSWLALNVLQFARARQTVGGKLRARLIYESSAGELFVEHPDADQHRRSGPRPPALTPQLSTASPGRCGALLRAKHFVGGGESGTFRGRQRSWVGVDQRRRTAPWSWWARIA